MSLDSSTGPSAALPMSLKIKVSAADMANTAGVLNDGFWGMLLKPHTAYRGSLYAKRDADETGGLAIALVSDGTGRPVATTTIPALKTEWQRYDFTLNTGDIPASAANHLTLTTAHAGTVWIDLVSLFPPTYHDRANGNRRDLMEKLAAMHPAFLRFPGGNYLEGDTLAQRYEWKKTIGPLVDRPTHPSPWTYHSSDGLGLLEYLEWCEDLHMQPVLAVYAGYSMQQQHVNPGPDLEPFVQDALDEIEYVSGDATTKWGAVRAKNGHPKPFALTYVEIGNEDNFDNSGSYSGRYAQFSKAIKARYPQLQLIATTPVTGIRPDVIDDHYYKPAKDFFNDTHHYDSYDRTGPKIFVGEWATREGSPTPDMGAALGDAAWMTGLERNSDLIVMASYAPLLVNVNPGGMQWDTDLIGYNTETSYGSPSYYAQVMFSNHLGKQVFASKLTGDAPRFFYSVTGDAVRGVLYLKLVNASSEELPLAIRLTGADHLGKTMTITSLSGTNPKDTNSIADPEHLVPHSSILPLAGSSFVHKIPAYSIQVMEIRDKD
jgi:alpha-N-arabinofuranosidase